jgi:lysozyme family protein
MLAAGLVLALLARGCDLLAKRSTDSATAQARVAQAQFDDPWTKQVSETQSRIAALEEKENPTPADTKEIQDARASLRDLEKAKQKALRSFQNGTLRDVTVAARDAESAYLIGAYWREMFFVFGAVVLALGLLMVSWVAEGAERWVSLMMLAIITVSLFLGSAVWMSK